MRQLKKKITAPEVIYQLLDAAPVGRLATVGPDGWPMVKPLNFARDGLRLYFHCAQEGEKLDHIGRDPRVCFEVDLAIAYVRGTAEDPCRANYLYRSAIALGRAHVVAVEAERRLALDLLMRKYQPQGGYGDYLPEKLALTAVVRIDIEALSGKEDLGKGDFRAQGLALLESGAPLPAVFG
ncbi:MAG TPA: pyridoxamine 5'-phosphate oxidase family protein [Geobacteraceae bacterium]